MSRSIVDIFKDLTQPLEDGIQATGSLISFYAEIEDEDDGIRRVKEKLNSINGLFALTQKLLNTQNFRVDELVFLQGVIELVYETGAGVEILRDIQAKLQSQQWSATVIDAEPPCHRAPYFRRRGTIGSIEDAYDDIFPSLSSANNMLSERGVHHNPTEAGQHPAATTIDTLSPTPEQQRKGPNKRELHILNGISYHQEMEGDATVTYTGPPTPEHLRSEGHGSEKRYSTAYDDYQMQLALLEEQKKKRLMIAR